MTHAGFGLAMFFTEGDAPGSRSRIAEVRASCLEHGTPVPGAALLSLAPVCPVRL